MFALYKISTNTVLQQWNDLPKFFSIAEELMHVHCPDIKWECGDYKLIPIKHKRRAAPNRFAKYTGSSEKVKFANNEPYLEVGTTFSEPSLDEVKGMLFDEIDNKFNASKQIDILEILTYLEAVEVIEDKTPTMDEYPLVALWLDHKNSDNILEAALFVIDDFKKKVKDVAFVEKTKAKLKADVAESKTITDADNLVRNAVWVEKVVE
jgi:hypothetical protein